MERFVFTCIVPCVERRHETFVKKKSLFFGGVGYRRKNQFPRALLRTVADAVNVKLMYHFGLSEVVTRG